MSLASISIMGGVLVALIVGLAFYFLRISHGKEAQVNGDGLTKAEQKAPAFKGMYADRTLAATGTGIILTGSLVSLVVSQAFSALDYHPLTAEAVTLVVISLASGVLVLLRLFKAMWIIVWSTILVFIVCVTTTIQTALDQPIVMSASVTLLDVVQERSIESISLLFRYHIGWWIIFVGIALLFWVAKNVRGKLFEVIPRSGPNLSVFGPRTSTIINEIIEAPKWPLMAGALLIMSGIIVLIAGNDISLGQKLAGTVVTELGFAFFIAFVILLTIEIKSHAERDRQISKGIISYIYGVNLDKELFLTTEEYIFKTPFYRNALELEYVVLRRKGDKLLLKYTISYVVKNVGRHEGNYSVHTFVEKPEAGATRSEAFPDVTLGLQKIIIDGVELPARDIEKARDRVPDTKDYMRSSHIIGIPAGESRRILGIHLMEKWVRDTELWQSVTPSSGVNLVVTWPDNLAMEMHAGAVHAANDGGDPRNGFDSKSYDANSLRAFLTKPLFPFNGVYLWWVCEPESVVPDWHSANQPLTRKPFPWNFFSRLAKARNRRK